MKRFLIGAIVTLASAGAFANTCNNGDGYTTSVHATTGSLAVSNKIACWPENAIIYEVGTNQPQTGTCSVSKTGFRSYSLTRTGGARNNRSSGRYWSGSTLACTFICIDAI